MKNSSIMWSYRGNPAFFVWIALACKGEFIGSLALEVPDSLEFFVYHDN